MVSLHGEPCLKSFLDGFPSVFDPSWSQSCPNGFPIVQLMFLYEARARARARARLVQEHQLHNWDPISASLGPGGPKNLRKPIKVNVNLRLDRPRVPSAWRRRCRPLPLGLNKQPRPVAVQPSIAKPLHISRAGLCRGGGGRTRGWGGWLLRSELSEAPGEWHFLAKSLPAQKQIRHPQLLDLTRQMTAVFAKFRA